MLVTWTLLLLSSYPLSFQQFLVSDTQPCALGLCAEPWMLWLLFSGEGLEIYVRSSFGLWGALGPQRKSAGIEEVAWLVVGQLVA